MLHYRSGSRSFRAVLFHKFHAGRGVEKQVVDGNCGTLRATAFLHSAGSAALQRHARTPRRAAAAGGDLNAAHCGDSGQGFTAKAQGTDTGKILFGAQFGGGVAQKGGGQFFRSDAAAVVADPNETHAAAAQFYAHCAGSRVNSVFQQFLDHAGGPFHDFAGCDHVGKMGW